MLLSSSFSFYCLCILSGFPHLLFPLLPSTMFHIVLFPFISFVCFLFHLSVFCCITFSFLRVFLYILIISTLSFFFFPSILLNFFTLIHSLIYSSFYTHSSFRTSPSVKFCGVSVYLSFGLFHFLIHDFFLVVLFHLSLIFLFLSIISSLPPSPCNITSTSFLHLLLPLAYSTYSLHPSVPYFLH